jgi:hypothetical protein
MEKRTCGLCGNADAWVYRSGAVLHGGYGSTRYDTTHLILTEGEGGLPGVERVCDACVNGLERDGAAHAYHTAIGETPAQAMPPAAYSAIFARYARITLEALKQHGAGPFRTGSEPSLDRIEALRADLEQDPSWTRSFRVGQLNFAPETIRVARAHVLAAVALGANLDEGMIDEAARRYGDAIGRAVTLMEELLDNLITQDLPEDG